MSGLQGVSTVRKNPRRPRARGRAAADSIGKPMAFLVFNRGGSSVVQYPALQGGEKERK